MATLREVDRFEVRMPGYLGEIAKSPALTAARYRRIAVEAARATGVRVHYRDHPYPRPGWLHRLRRVLPARYGSLYSAEPEGTDLAPFFRHWSRALDEIRPGSNDR